MFGFLKKFKKSKKDKDQDEKYQKKETLNNEESSEASKEKSKITGEKKKKKLPVKLIIIILLVLVAVGASGFVVYKFYFSASASNQEAPKYQKKILKYLSLPDEILEFGFYHFPNLYSNLVIYNAEMTLLDTEIERIKVIGNQYPDQKKIADKEIKTWEKTKSTLEKSFLKIQKPVKETYVLFLVNKEQGLVRIDALRDELAKAAIDALTPVQEMTGKLKTTENIPEGLLKGTLYKLKKKFL